MNVRYTERAIKMEHLRPDAIRDHFPKLVRRQWRIRKKLFPNLVTSLCCHITTTSDARDITSLKAEGLVKTYIFFNDYEKPTGISWISKPTTQSLENWEKKRVNSLDTIIRVCIFLVRHVDINHVWLIFGNCLPRPLLACCWSWGCHGKGCLLFLVFELTSLAFSTRSWALSKDIRRWWWWWISHRWSTIIRTSTRSSNDRIKGEIVNGFTASCRVQVNGHLRYIKSPLEPETGTQLQKMKLLVLKPPFHKCWWKSEAAVLKPWLHLLCTPLMFNTCSHFVWQMSLICHTLSHMTSKVLNTHPPHANLLPMKFLR